MLNSSAGFWSLVIAAVIAHIVGFLWWGPLFGKSWAREMRLTAKDMEKAKKKGMAKPMIIMFIANLIMAYVLSGIFTLTGVIGMSSAWALSFWIWLGFVATIAIGGVLWENKSWNLFFINSVGWLASIFAVTWSLMTF